MRYSIIDVVYGNRELLVSMLVVIYGVPHVRQGMLVVVYGNRELLVSIIVIVLWVCGFKWVVAFFCKSRRK